MLSLTPEQKIIVEAPLLPPLKVIAGAGTGKTYSLTGRYIHLIRNFKIKPQNILAITFTEKAAKEMKERITSELGQLDLPILETNISTIHSFAAGLLRRYAYNFGFTTRFEILDDIQKEILKHQLFKKIMNDRTPPKYLNLRLNKVLKLLSICFGRFGSFLSSISAIVAPTYTFTVSVKNHRP